MPPSAVPDPRPGTCQNTVFKRDSKAFNGNASEANRGDTNFIKHHPLMDLSVPSLNNRLPLFVKTSLAERLTVIAVDSKVQSVSDNRLFDVLFVGTTRGRVLKLISQDQAVAPTLIESIQVFDFQVPVTNLLVTSDNLIVLNDKEVSAISLARCDDPSVKNCGDCVALQDPYCAWSLTESKCAAVKVGRRYDMLQNVKLGFHPDCPIETKVVTTTTTTTTTTTRTTTTTQRTTSVGKN